jgi:hypothetical protein
MEDSLVVNTAMVRETSDQLHPERRHPLGCHQRGCRNWASWLLTLCLGCGGGNRIETLVPAPDAAAAPASTSPRDAPFSFTPPDGAIADGPAVAATTCAAEVHQAERVPVDLVLVVDQSPSMLFKIGTRSKWDLAREALLAFLQDQRSAGLNVGLQSFPVPSRNSPCASDDDCGFPFACVGTPRTCSGYPLPMFPSCAWRDYQTLAVPIADLPAGAPPLVAAVSSMNPNPNVGVSAIGTAAQGVFAHLRERLQAHPDHQAVLVLVTDGVPSGCFYGWVDAAGVEKGIAGEAAASPAIRTYVIGLFSADKQEDADGPAALQRFAAAGGTMAPFIVKPPADVVGQFGDALARIRQASLPCTFSIPAPGAATGALDYGKVNLHIQSPAGEDDVPYVATAARCDPARGGWYYDADPSTGAHPTQISACPATCRRLESEATQASLTFGCATVVIQ